MGRKIVSIHQPNYLPWLGYFFKLYASDVFVYMDDVQHSKQSLTKRVFIRKAKHSADTLYLTVPIAKESNYSWIRDIPIHQKSPWVDKQLAQIRGTYKGSPHFASYFPMIESWLRKGEETDLMADFNIHMIECVIRELGIETERVRSGNLPVEGKRSAYVVNLVKHLSGNVYLSGMGARKYQSEEEFSEENITLLYNDFKSYLDEHPYPQKEGPELMGLSVVDALFNIGAEGILELFGAYHRILFKGTE